MTRSRSGYRCVATSASARLICLSVSVFACLVFSYSPRLAGASRRSPDCPSLASRSMQIAPEPWIRGGHGGVRFRD